MLDELTIGRGITSAGEQGVMFILPAGAFIENHPSGEPRPGVVMTTAQAREIAYALLLNAEQVASGRFNPTAADTETTP